MVIVTYFEIISLLIIASIVVLFSLNDDNRYDLALRLLKVALIVETLFIFFSDLILVFINIIKK